MKQISNGLKKISKSQIAQIGVLVLFMVLALAPVASAQLPVGGVGTGCEGRGVPCDSSITTLISRIINIGLAIAGLVAVLFLIIGGFRYITSGGNEETAEQAKKIIINSIIGIVIIILAFVIVRVITGALGSTPVI